MNIFLSVLLFVAGLVLVIYFAEKLVEGAVGTSLGFGISAFLVSVIFIGFDPENLAVGAVGSFEGVAGIALGSVIGACMVAIAFAFGITALLVPLRFEEVPKQILTVPILAVLLLGGARSGSSTLSSRWNHLVVRVRALDRLSAMVKPTRPRH